MQLTIEATYEDGVLKPASPLPLADHTQVRITVHPAPAATDDSEAVIPCTDPQLIEWAASDPQLDFPLPADQP